jgi:DNA-binding MarR family transcriptional regulator
MGVANILGYQITQANLAGLANFEQAVTGPFKLRPVDYTILQLVHDGQCNTLSQLAKELQMTPPSVSVWLDKLTARRLLRRSKGDTDGRTQQLQLTDSGRELTLHAHEALLKSEQQLMSVLSPGERVILFEILQKLCAKSPSSP